MALRRYTRPVDGSIPVKALLYNDEELLATQDNVGIYDGSQKSPEHQNGTVYVTSHRLFYIDARHDESCSFALDLSAVSQTEHYAGLFKSSPKVTCYLSGTPIYSGSSLEQGGTEEIHANSGFESWECDVCAYRNPPGLSPAAARICGLCGVPRTAVPAPVTSVPSHHLSSSLPSSSSVTLASITESSSQPPGKQTSVACPACTFLNHPSLRSCELCSTELPRRPKPRGELKSAPSSRPISPDPDDDEGSTTKMVKVSFRRGGDKHFYAVLKRSLKSKAWEGSTTLTRNSNSSEPSSRGNAGTPGISGILRTVESSTQGRETHMNDALHDLEALMVKAKDMVKLAAELNEKLTAASASAAAASDAHGYAPSASSSTEPEEATFIRSSLSQLGLHLTNAPVTLDMMKDERNWYDELARELAGVLQGSGLPIQRSGEGNAGWMMKHRGIIALDEVWGGWNRARGVALIPPSTFLQVIPYLPSHTEPAIRHRVFTSGLSVLHTPPYTPAAFAARLTGHLALGGSKNTMDVASEEGLNVGLVAEMIDSAEEDGAICRDDSTAAIVGGGVSGTGVEIRWWGNLFVGYIWDGQE